MVSVNMRVFFFSTCLTTLSTFEEKLDIEKPSEFVRFTLLAEAQFDKHTLAQEGITCNANNWNHQQTDQSSWAEWDLSLLTFTDTQQ